MRKFVLASFLLLLAASGQEIFACSCIPVRGQSWNVAPKDRLGQYESDTIFLGKVIRIEDDSKDKTDPEAILKVTFAVERVWARRQPGADKDQSEITVWTYRGDGMCGIAFKEGGRYFVFATKYDETHMCTPTTEYDERDAPDYFKFLGEGREPGKVEKPGASNKKPASAERPPPGRGGARGVVVRGRQDLGRK